MNVPLVTKSFEVEVPNDSNDPVLNTYVDLSMLLSEYYGKNIRQGQTFYLKGISAYLEPDDDGAGEDYDVGLAATAIHRFCPTTKHSRKAWNLIFQQWKKQKYLSGKVGSYMRNDDFEVGWDASTAYHDTTRTSTIYAQGMGDTTTEKVVIWGGSDDDSDFTLQDFYNSQLDPVQNLPSVDPFTSATIKGNKYGSTAFPEQQMFLCSASSSAVVTEVSSLGTNTQYSGGRSVGDWNEFPVPAQIMCGLMKVNIYVNPPDTAAQIEDNAILHITYHIGSWKPLVWRPRARKSKGYTRKSSRRSRRGKSRRRRR